jgi:hypothetical protein
MSDILLAIIALCDIALIAIVVWLIATACRWRSEADF